MTKLLNASALVLFTLAIAACSDDAEAPEADTVTETRMDEVDVIDGTISDDMVDIDAEKNSDELAEGETADEDSDDAASDSEKSSETAE